MARGAALRESYDHEMSNLASFQLVHKMTKMSSFDTNAGRNRSCIPLSTIASLSHLLPQAVCIGAAHCDLMIL